MIKGNRKKYEILLEKLIKKRPLEPKIPLFFLNMRKKYGVFLHFFLDALRIMICYFEVLFYI